MSKVINEIGHQYGHLKVLERAPNKSNGCAVWKCQCDCGNISFVLGADLRSGNTTTCGKCNYYKEKLQQGGRKSYLDLTNQKFGKLTALKPIGSYNYGGIKWLCQCDCGNLHYVEASNLKNGKVQSCGCLVSKGEQRIQKFLNENGVIYKTQFTPSGFKYENGYNPFFDFAVFDENNNLKFLLEYQGEQHYKYYNNKNTWNNKENFEKNQKRDNEKKKMCEINNIKLYEISYLDFDKIENLLYNILQSEKHSTVNK